MQTNAMSWRRGSFKGQQAVHRGRPGEVPPHGKPGDSFEMPLPSGRKVTVVVPPDATPGSTFTVPYPAKDGEAPAAPKQRTFKKRRRPRSERHRGRNPRTRGWKQRRPPPVEPATILARSHSGFDPPAVRRTAGKAAV